MAALEGDIGERTAGTFTTESQRRRIEAKERGGLTEQLGTILRGSERERAGLSTSLADIENQLNLRVQQEGRDIEPVSKALEFAGFNLTGARGDEQGRLQNILAALTGDRGTELDRIGLEVGQSQQREQNAQQESQIRLQSELDQQAQLLDTISAGISDSDQSFIIESAQDLLDRGVSTTEITRIVRAAKPSIDPSQLQALIELATQGTPAGGGQGLQGGQQQQSGASKPAGPNSLVSPFQAGGNVPGLQRLPSTGGSPAQAGGRGLLFSQ